MPTHDMLLSIRKFGYSLKKLIWFLELMFKSVNGVTRARMG
jgi:hypothetical protein